MTSTTGIEWTDSTWNPIVGCSVVSPGCTNCYAMAMAARIEAMQEASHYAGTTRRVKGNVVWTGKVALAPDHILTAPLRWKKPRRVFVNSMGDLFHESVPDEWIDCVFAVMALAPQHKFQVLTKRAERMQRYFEGISGQTRRSIVNNECFALNHWLGTKFTDAQCGIRKWPLPGVWLGVSAEDQTRADERIPDLLDTPAAVRFVSAEPLLGPIDFTHIDYGAPPPFHTNALRGYCDNGTDTKIDWTIVGGESGPGARPMHPDWARSIRDQCAAAGTAFFFKQWGEWRPNDVGYDATRVDRCTVCYDGRVREWQDDYPDARLTDPRMRSMIRIGKKRAGRLLDGREHSEFPS